MRLRQRGGAVEENFLAEITQSEEFYSWVSIYLRLSCCILQKEVR